MRQRVLEVLLVALLASEGVLLYRYVQMANELDQLKHLLQIVLGTPVES
jgi:hypothetical protein